MNSDETTNRMVGSTVPPGSTPRPPWIVWAGMAIVLAAAAVLSFDGLQGLAITVAIPGHLAWLLPIVVDAGAAVSCATWLGGRSTADAARYAGRMTWALLAATVIGNAGHLGMVAEGIRPPWWCAVLVGAIAPAVVGTTVHLVVLLTRRVPDVTVSGATHPAPATTAAEAVVDLNQAEPRPGPDRHSVPRPRPAAAGKADRSDEELLSTIRGMADKAGSKPTGRQVRALGVGPDRAKRLLEEFDQTGPRRTA